MSLRNNIVPVIKMYRRFSLLYFFNTVEKINILCFNVRISFMFFFNFWLCKTLMLYRETAQSIDKLGVPGND